MLSFMLQPFLSTLLMGLNECFILTGLQTHLQSDACWERLPPQTPEMIYPTLQIPLQPLINDH